MLRRLALACSLLAGLLTVSCGGDSAGDASSGTTAGSGAGAGTGAGATTGTGATGSGGGSDEYGPWEGGAEYYGKWKNGPPSDPSFFPITVWLQSPDRAADYKAIGIDMFIGLWEGPTDAQLTTLAAAGMPAACDQNDVGLAHASDKTIEAWTHQDEPDNAQPDGMGGYDPCVATDAIVDLYKTMKTKDPSRPVFLNFGRGVSDENWIGRGDCTGHLDDYPKYIQGADIVSYDIYPVNDRDPPTSGNLWYVAQGVDRLREYSNYQKPVWNWIECTAISDPTHKPSPADVRAEVWMSIVHGSLGIGYFVHQFEPSFDEHALLDDPEMKAAVAAINQQIHDLAPVLNTPPLAKAASVASSAADVPIDILAKRGDGALYVFAVAMRGSATHGTFDLSEPPGATSAEVLGEGRTVPLQGGSFEDDFDGYGVHLYKIGP